MPAGAESGSFELLDFERALSVELLIVSPALPVISLHYPRACSDLLLLCEVYGPPAHAKVEGAELRSNELRRASRLRVRRSISVG